MNTEIQQQQKQAVCNYDLRLKLISSQFQWLHAAYRFITRIELGEFTRVSVKYEYKFEFQIGRSKEDTSLHRFYPFLVLKRIHFRKEFFVVLLIFS